MSKNEPEEEIIGLLTLWGDDITYSNLDPNKHDVADLKAVEEQAPVSVEEYKKKKIVIPDNFDDLTCDNFMDKQDLLLQALEDQSMNS